MIKYNLRYYERVFGRCHYCNEILTQHGKSLLSEEKGKCCFSCYEEFVLPVIWQDELDECENRLVRIKNEEVELKSRIKELARHKKSLEKKIEKRKAERMPV